MGQRIRAGVVRRLTFVIAALGATVATGMAAGCSAVDEISGGTGGIAGDAVVSEQAALNVCACSGSDYQKFVVNGNVFGPDASTHICWPTVFESPATQPSPSFSIQTVTEPVPGGRTFWKAVGKGTMECIPQCCFSSNGGSSDWRARSSGYVAQASLTYPPTEGKETIVNMWQSDAMAILSGLAHHHTGGLYMKRSWENGEARGDPSNPSLPARLRANARATSPFGGSTSTTAYGYSFFVGIPQSGHTVRRKGYVMLGNGPTTMLQETAGICTFSFVSGVKPQSIPKLYRQNGVWRGEQVGTTPGEVWVNCYYFHQDQ